MIDEHDDPLSWIAGATVLHLGILHLAPGRYPSGYRVIEYPEPEIQMGWLRFRRALADMKGDR